MPRMKVRRVPTFEAAFKFPEAIEPKIGIKLPHLESFNYGELCIFLNSKYDKWAMVREGTDSESTTYTVHVAWYSPLTLRYGQTLMKGHWFAISPPMPTPEEAMRFAINADHL